MQLLATHASHTHTHAHKGSTDAPDECEGGTQGGAQTDALVVLCFEKSSSSEPFWPAASLMSCGLYGKDFGSRMPPSPGKKMPCMSIVPQMMTMPSLMKPPSRLVPPMMYLDEMRAPVLPPAPTMPETTPSAGREMYGTMPKCRPSAICTQIEKQIMTSMVRPSVPPLCTQVLPGSLIMMSEFAAIGMSVSTPSTSACAGERTSSEAHLPTAPTSPGMVYVTP